MFTSQSSLDLPKASEWLANSVRGCRLKIGSYVFLFHRRYAQLTRKNSSLHAKHEIVRTLSQIRITDTSNSASKRSYDHQVRILFNPYFRTFLLRCHTPKVKIHV